jgi:hypothetical protein
MLCSYKTDLGAEKLQLVVKQYYFICGKLCNYITVGMYVCIYEYIYLFMCVCKYACMCVRTYVRK